MDLPAASALVVLVNGLSKSGKVVRVLRPNALVGALIESLRPDPRVQLVPTKPISRSAALTAPPIFTG